MGGSLYSTNLRSDRAKTMNYASVSAATADNYFEQNKKREIHESMDPKGIKLREARDSDTHPLSVPIIFALDVTGSMRNIPYYLVREGLPNIMGKIIQKGIKDPQILFLAVGDTECDRFPLQVGQFESGDLELDTWLLRTYLEGGGGGNEGESYLLAWYFAALYTVTDAWEKRSQKGFLFTIGDEPGLKSLPAKVIKTLMGEGAQAGFTDVELLTRAQEKWNVYHLHMMEGSAGPRSLGYWQQLLGDNCIEVHNQNEVAAILSGIVTKNVPESHIVKETVSDDSGTGTPPKKPVVL